MFTFTRREVLRRAGVLGLGITALLAGCQPKVVEKVVTKEVEKIVKETVVIEKEVKPAKLPAATLRYGFAGFAQQYVTTSVAAFQTLQPDVTVNLEPIAGDASQKFFTMAAGGTLPEVIWITNHQVMPFAEGGVTLDMMPMAATDPDLPTQDIYPVLFRQCQFKGGWYMVPWAADAPVMYYNKALFQKAGLPEPPPEGLTVDKFIEAGKAITNEKEQVYGVSISHAWVAIYLAWFRGYGGDFFDDKGRCAINAPQCIEAAQALADLYVKHKCAVPVGADLGGEPFFMGKAGMGFANRVWCTNLRDIKAKFEWDVALPVRQPVKHVAGGGTMGPAVGNSAKKKELVAYELARSMIRPSVQRYFARQYLMIPVLLSMAKDPAWYELPAPPGRRDVFIDIWTKIAGVIPPLLNPQCGTFGTGLIFDTMKLAWDEMVISKVPPQTALDKAAKTLNDCIASKGPII